MNPNDDSSFESNSARSEFDDGINEAKPDVNSSDFEESMLGSSSASANLDEPDASNVASQERRARTDREVLADARRDAFPQDESPRPREDAPRSEVTSRLFWVLASATILMCVWKIGPQIIEDYQYAMTAGSARAEYEVAVDYLKDNPLQNVSQAYQLVARRIRPSVVSVRTERPHERTRGQGSGVLMSKDGYILTNAHVVTDASRIQVALYDRHKYEAVLIGVDPDSDLAVIKIDAPDLIPADWGDSEELQVGSIVWAIGSPYGLDQTVTSGIVSGKNRLDEDHQNRELLQTDAAVNPGNSGGPLVDAQGEVIGINTSIFGETFQGISFAVPSTTARFVYQQLIENGSVTRGYLGVRPRTVFQDIANRLKLSNLDGAYIPYVQPNSPAYFGGLKDEDVILKWNDHLVTVHTMLYRLVEMTPPNESARVIVARDGELEELQIQVGDRSELLGR